MDAYDPAAVFSSIDHGGRYAYANQPRIAHWNLARLAETLLPLLAGDEDAAVADAKAALATFGPAFEAAYTAGLCRKIGLSEPRVGDAALAEDLLDRMAANGADFTLTFRRLCDAASDPGNGSVRALFADPAAFDAWVEGWRRRLAGDGVAPEARRTAMLAANPAFIPRNHQVEAAIAAAVGRADFTPFEALLGVLARPYDDQPEFAAYAAPPAPGDRVLQTFCGT
jgi:uncharacterized protein YdiU (UPF0061 family)